MTPEAEARGCRALWTGAPAESWARSRDFDAVCQLAGSDGEDFCVEPYALEAAS